MVMIQVDSDGISSQGFEHVVLDMDNDILELLRLAQGDVSNIESELRQTGQVHVDHDEPDPLLVSLDAEVLAVVARFHLFQAELGRGERLHDMVWDRGLERVQEAKELVTPLT